MAQTKLLTALVVALTVAGCAHLPAQQAELKPSTAWVANSPEWRAEAEQVFTEATAHVASVEASLPDGSWGVILDLDETVLNNVQYQIERDLAGESFSDQSWFAWTQREEATLVPGAEAFIERVNALGGHVAFVTNRRDTEQLATENNLQSHGLIRNEDFRVLLTRALPSAPSNKDTRFALVAPMLAAQGYPDVEIIAYVGDGNGDKPSSPGDWRFFCIDQGAMYGDYCAQDPR